MISLNSLLETVTRSAEEYHQLNKGIGKKETVDCPIENTSKKDVAIINPTLQDGQGDYELARKLQKLISSKGLQVVTRSLAKVDDFYDPILGKQEKLKSNFIIIAPFGFCRPKALIKRQFNVRAVITY